MRRGNKISQQCSITNTHTIHLKFSVHFGDRKASKRHPSQFMYGKQEEKAAKWREREGWRQRKRGAMARARALQRAEDNAELAESLPRARGNRVPHGAPYEPGQPGGGCGPQCMYACVSVSAFVHARVRTYKSKGAEMRKM